MNNFIYVVLFFVMSSVTVTSQMFDFLNLIQQFYQRGQEYYETEAPIKNYLLDSYDFIIVGAGSAGCVLANRLTENSNWTVLLLEAGDRENFVMDLPWLVHAFQQTNVNWKYKTEPSNEYCLGMENHQCNWPRGKVMGGSSVLNYMIYNRGNRRDYDKWAELGNPGWDYESVLPYFKKIENAQVHNVKTDDKYRGRRGPITVTDDFFSTEISDGVIAAGIELGFPHIDHNGPSQVSVSKVQSNIKDGLRQSSNYAYLRPIRNRPNLHIKRLSQVTRVLFNEATKTAIGVEFIHLNRRYKVKARREVILSAGAINSPQLLMLSGIGPARHLQRFGIKPLSDLPVGENLMDHIALGGVTILPHVELKNTVDEIIRLSSWNEFHRNGSGAWTSPGGCQSILFYDSNSGSRSTGHPDIELLQMSGQLNSFPFLRINGNIKESVAEYAFGELKDTLAFSILPMILRPYSKGRLFLKSRNPFKHPAIVPNYLSDRRDIETAIKGVRLIQELVKTKAMKEHLGAQLWKKPLRECRHHQYDSDTYWECHLRTLPITIYHYSGTAKMGPADDPTSVVDARLRVYGVKNLRVVDASIMPEIIAGHPNGPVMMIAEKAADIIKEDWNYRA